MYVSEFSWTDSSVARNGLTEKYEPLQPPALKWLSRFLGVEYFFDIGANIGYYSIFLSPLPGIKHIYAFEAIRDTYAELRGNIALNNLEGRIDTINKGVFSSECVQEFGVVGELSGANGIKSTTFHHESAFKTMESVECTSIDNFIRDSLGGFARNMRLGFKIDVEGAEMEVIKGMDNTLRDHICLIQVETYKDNLEGMRAMLASMNYYEIIHIGPDHYFSNSTLPINIREMFEYAAGELIRNNLAKPKNANPIVQSKDIDLKVSRDEDRTLKILIAEKRPKFALPEYALYVYKNDDELRKFAYQSQGEFCVAMDEIEPNDEIKISAFCRDQKNHASRHVGYAKFTTKSVL